MQYWTQSIYVRFYFSREILFPLIFIGRGCYNDVFVVPSKLSYHSLTEKCAIFADASLISPTVPEEAAQVRQVGHPRLGPVRAGADRGR